MKISLTFSLSFCSALHVPVSTNPEEFYGVNLFTAKLYTRVCTLSATIYLIDRRADFHGLHRFASANVTYIFEKKN